jgi:cation-transporting ATPase 13A2
MCAVLSYSIGSNLSNYMFLWQDLCCIVPLAMTMGFTGPYEHLTIYRPSGALISFPVLASTIGTVAIITAGQIFLCFIVKS